MFFLKNLFSIAIPFFSFGISCISFAKIETPDIRVRPGDKKGTLVYEICKGNECFETFNQKTQSVIVISEMFAENNKRAKDLVGRLEAEIETEASRRFRVDG